MTTWADYREQETARLADEFAAIETKFWAQVAEAPWYGRWSLRALYWACKLWARVRREIE